MTTIKYGRYVCVNKEKGSVVWHESKQSAMDNQKENGGELYDFTKDNPVIIERALSRLPAKRWVWSDKNSMQ